MHRKAAIRKFARLQTDDPALHRSVDGNPSTRSMSPEHFGLCGKRPVRSAENSSTLWSLTTLSSSDGITSGIIRKQHQKLLSMSEATDEATDCRICAGTHSSSWHGSHETISTQLTVPIFTGPWEDKPPGYGQIDTVAHCGSSLVGDLRLHAQLTRMRRPCGVVSEPVEQRKRSNTG